MKSYLILFVSLFFCGITVSIKGAIDLKQQRHSGGSGVGNGAEEIDPSNIVVWFQDENRSVKWCIDVKSNEQVGKKEIEYAFLAALSIWENYFIHKQVFTHLAYRPIPEFNFTYQENCNNPDLKIIMGNRKELKDYKSKYSDPIGYVQITNIVSNKWHKGNLWISSGRDHQLYFDDNQLLPNWKIPYTLQGLLTHELGHIFGIDDVPMTIMDKDIKKLILPAARGLYPSPLRKFLMTSIDQRLELYSCPECDVYYFGLEELKGRGGTGRPRRALEWMFKKFARKINLENREIRLMYHQKGKLFEFFFLAQTLAGKPTAKKTVKIIIEDLILEYPKKEYKLFKVMNAESGLDFLFPVTRVYLGYIVASDGSHIQIKLWRNDARFGPVSIDVKINGKYQNLFRGSNIQRFLKHYQSIRNSLPM